MAEVGRRRCRNCFFFQERACVLGRRWGFACPMHVVKISGITDTIDYLQIVNTSRAGARSFWLSLGSILISLLALGVALAGLLLQAHRTFDLNR